MTRSLDQIIDDLGGEGAVAERLGCGRSAISNWKVRGLPKGRWIDLVDMAAGMNLTVPITLEDVRRASEAITALPVSIGAA
jgi:hypothetical protein